MSMMNLLNDRMFLNQYNIRITGTPDDPWFCGKDVAIILGYKNANQAIRKNVRDKHRKSFSEIRGVWKTPLSYNQANLVYINEAGLYTLILRSKLPIAYEFQDWVTEEVLPSIRKTGQYQINEKILQLENELTISKRSNLLLSNYVQNVKERTREQCVYIATTRQYASENIFKIGGCSSYNLLKKRLATYNTGRPVEDLLYYTKLFKCHNYKHVENRVKEILCDYRNKKDKEMYVLHYDCLEQIITLIIENYNNETEHLNNIIKGILQSVIKTPVIPEPLQLDRVEIKRYKDGDEVEEKIVNLEHLNEIAQEKYIKNMLNNFTDDNFTDDNKSTVIRKDFEIYLENNGVIFKSRNLWRHLKRIGKILEINMKW